MKIFLIFRLVNNLYNHQSEPFLSVLFSTLDRDTEVLVVVDRLLCYFLTCLKGNLWLYLSQPAFLYLSVFNLNFFFAQIILSVPKLGMSVYTYLQPDLLLYNRTISNEPRSVFFLHLFLVAIDGMSLIRGGPWLSGHRESEEIEMGKNIQQESIIQAG